MLSHNRESWARSINLSDVCLQILRKLLDALSLISDRFLGGIIEGFIRKHRSSANTMNNECRYVRSDQAAILWACFVFVLSFK